MDKKEVKGISRFLFGFGLLLFIIGLVIKFVDKPTLNELPEELFFLGGVALFAVGIIMTALFSMHAHT